MSREALLFEFLGMPKDQTAAQFRNYHRTDCSQFPRSVAPGLTRGGILGRGNETVTDNSRAPFEFYLLSVRHRPHGTGARHGLLAWRRFRQKRGLEWCTATRGSLCS